MTSKNITILPLSLYFIKHYQSLKKPITKYLEPVENGKKIPNQETDLENRGHQKVLNDTKLVPNEHDRSP